jgi:hypothetical protein
MAECDSAADHGHCLSSANSAGGRDGDARRNWLSAPNYAAHRFDQLG